MQVPGLLYILGSIIVRFDGSVRRPSDPGFPLDHLVPQAACAAVVLRDDGERLIAVGGKRLRGYTSSIEAEYEGLLLGLEASPRMAGMVWVAVAVAVADV